MSTLNVVLDERSYPIVIGDGLLRQPDLICQHIPAQDVLLISNTIVAPLYIPLLRSALSDKRIAEVILPDGESHKTLATVARIIDVLITNRYGRDCVVVALGGGVVGDMAGFSAACYHRGVGYVQVPTTLLAQVDSAVGGKTGVNHPGGKNLIGAFHQPRAVLTDTATLATLPPREMRAGLAEVIKYGLICDSSLFEWLEQHLDELLAYDAPALAHVIRRSCEIKAAIVRRDEREHGERALLNLGHTFGHAIESATHYRQWLHGEAVGTGLLMAAAMSRECGYLSPAEVQRVASLLQRAGLPVKVGGIATTQLLEHMRIDKKVRGGRLRLILLKRIGESFVSDDYPDQALQRTLDAYLA